MFFFLLEKKTILKKIGPQIEGKNNKNIEYDFQKTHEVRICKNISAPKQMDQSLTRP